MTDTNFPHAREIARMTENESKMYAFYLRRYGIKMACGENASKEREDLDAHINSLLAAKDAEIERLTAELNALRPMMGRYYTLTDAARREIEDAS